MSVAGLEAECSRLQAEARQGLESSARQLQAEFAEKLAEASRAACQSLEAALAEASLAAHPLPVSSPEVDGGPPAPGSFADMLAEPAVPVRIGADTVYVHKPILRRMPYFQAQLDGPWSDADTPKVSLPCNAEEFGLLVRRFYTGEPLRSPTGPTLSCAAVLRLAAAADMLMVVGQMPELPELLRHSILTPEDAQLAACAAAVLPAELAAPLSGLSGAPALQKQAVEEMIWSARTEEAQDAAAAILHAQRGRLDADGVAKTAGRLLASGSAPSVRWAARVARDHLDAEQGTKAFDALVRVHRCLRVDSEVQCAAHAAYVDHIFRCARQGSTAALAGALALPEARARHHNPCPNTYEVCCNSAYNPLLLTSADTAALVAAARAAPPAGRAALGEQLGAQLCAGVLAQLLTDDLLAALGGAAEPIVVKIATEPNHAVQWATPARLAALPLAQRRHICADALVRYLGGLRPEVASLIGSTLA